MGWYKSGTVSLVNGETTVTGTGTQFRLGGTREGDSLNIDGLDYEIASVTSDTELELALPYSGTIDTASPYSITKTQNRVSELTDATTSLLTKFGGLTGSVDDFNELIESRADDAEDAAIAANADAVATAADRVAVAADKATVAADKATVAADKGTVAADKATVAADKSTVATDKGIVAADKATVAADKALTLGYKNDAAASAAAAATFVPSNYVLKAGDALTGALTLPGAPTSNLHAATKKYVDDGLALKLDLTGGNVTGNLGIGTTPSAKLHTKSASELFRLETTTARGSGNGFMSFYDPTGRKGYFGYGGGTDDMYLSNEMNGSLKFITNSVEGMRLIDGGVGIGTSTISDRLVVQGCIRATASSGGFGNGQEGAFMDFVPGSAVRIGYIQGSSGTAKPIAIMSAGNQLASWATNGDLTTNGVILNRNYGAGVSSAAFRATLNSGNGGAYISGYSVDASYIHNAEYVSGTGWVARHTDAALYQQWSGNHSWYGNTGLTSGSGFTPTHRMTLTSAGNLGLGTSTPRGRLHSTEFTIYQPTAAADVRALYLGESTNTAGYRLVGGMFYSGGSFRAALDAVAAEVGTDLIVNPSGGNLGLCGTGTVAISGYRTVTLNGDTNGSVFDMTQGGGMKLRFVASSVGAAIETAASIPLYFTPGGNQRLNLSTGGNLTMTPAATGAVTTPAYIALGNDYTTTETAENCKIFLYNTGGVDMYGIGVGSNADMQFHAGGAGNTLGRYAWFSGNNKRMALDQSGNLHPGTDGTGQVGTSSKRWGVIFSTTGTINTSDEREKEWRGKITTAELAAGKQIIAELGFYQWKDAIEVKGADARYHFGAKAQTVWNIMTQHGLVDPIDENGRPGKTPYGFLCYDEWIDEEGEAQNRFGLRPDELTLFLIAAQESRLAALEATIH